MSLNAYLSFKRVRAIANNAFRLAGGTTASGRAYGIAIVEEEPYPAIILDVEGVGAMRIGLTTLVESVVGAEARDVDRWTPLERAVNDPLSPGTVLYGNEQVTVSVREDPQGAKLISYHYRDRAPIRDWRIGMRIKDEIGGPDWEAIEQYPAQSRLVDESNEYWITAFPPGHLMHEVLSNNGMQKRSVMTQDEIDEEGFSTKVGISAVQRDW